MIGIRPRLNVHGLHSRDTGSFPAVPSGRGLQERSSMSPPPMTPRLANAFELQRSIEMANADPEINDFGSLGR